jgi:putative flippase GtrA
MLSDSKTKKDLQYSLISGLMTGFIVWRLTIFLGIPEFFGIKYYWLIIVLPILWFLGVNLGYFLGRFFKPFNQFGRFAAVGFTNAAVDFGILNLLIALSGVATGIFFSIFKTTSFLVALSNSYFFNKYWTFEAGKSHGGIIEFFSFGGVVVFAWFVNVGTASLVVYFIDPIGNLTPEAWANVGAVVGSAAALLFSFGGFKKVFNK